MSDLKVMKQVYLDAQRNCGIEVGDYVKVLRKVDSFESGWTCGWFSAMDLTVEKVGKVLDKTDSGISVRFEELNNVFVFPYFVLEKVGKPIYVPKPFDRVLVRDDDKQEWLPDIFLYCDFKNNSYQCANQWWNYCIPYEGNEHLNGTTDEPEE